MRYTPRTMLATVTAGAAVALGAGLFGAGAAYATYEDPRATPVDGNAVTCEDAGLAGEDITGLLTVDGGVPNVDQYLTVTAVETGTVVTGIVVKGGDAYNVYVPGANELPLLPPWEDLQSPLNGGHQVPQISHWYACGVTTEPSTPPTSEPSTPPTSEPSTPATDSPAPSSSVAPVGAPPAGSAPELAATGFDSAQWIGLGVLLAAAGAALLALPRLRRRTQ